MGTRYRDIGRGGGTRISMFVESSRYAIFDSNYNRYISVSPMNIVLRSKMVGLCAQNLTNV